MRKRCIAIPLSLTILVVLSLVTSPVCYAFGGDFPEKTMIISVQELVEWYQSDVQEGFLGDEIVISGTVHLTQALGEKKLPTMPKGLRLQEGGVLLGAENLPYDTVVLDENKSPLPLGWNGF